MYIYAHVSFFLTCAQLLLVALPTKVAVVYYITTIAESGYCGARPQKGRSVVFYPCIFLSFFRDCRRQEDRKGDADARAHARKREKITTITQRVSPTKNEKTTKTNWTRSLWR